MQSKKALLINTNYGTGGGAEMIATHLLNGLEQYGYDAKMIVGKKTREHPKVFSKIGSPLRISGREISMEKAFRKLTGLNDILFNWPFLLIFNKKFREADVINMHNLHGNYFSILALPLISRLKKTVWTLHDTWAITGRAATIDAVCTSECYKMKRCEHMDIYPIMYKNRTRFFKKLKKLIYRYSKLTIVCPSNWLANEVKKSGMFPEHTEIKVIHNGLDISRFITMTKNKAREHLGLPDNKKILFFQAGWVNDPRKGIIDALKSIKLKNPGEVFLIIMGHFAEEMKALIPNTIGGYKLLSYVDNSEVPAYFAASDLLAFPSWYENLSTTMIESLASGTPVVAFNTGGNKEIVDHMVNGYIAKHKDYKDFWRGVDKVLNKVNRKNFSKKASEKAEKNFGLNKFLQEYVSLFSS